MLSVVRKQLIFGEKKNPLSRDKLINSILLGKKQLFFGIRYKTGVVLGEIKTAIVWEKKVIA